MKKHWLAVLIGSVLLLGLAGCAPQEPAAPEPGEVEEVAAVGMDVDAAQTPPPREALEKTPDLSGGRFVINDRTLGAIADDGVPGDVVEELESLRGEEYTNASEFLAAVRDAIGSAATDEHGDSILRNALVMELANEPPAPGEEMALVEAAEQPEGGLGDDVFDAVYFDFDRSNIKPEFRDAIRQNAQVLLDNPNVVVTIEGHCDERGTTEYNLALGQRRADSVKRALLEQGVDESQLQTVSYGEERPVDPGHNEEAWAKNRRGVLTITQQ